ncbi:MAG TPA: glucoamylase family protein [Jiangellaceae bacterium]|nr:glucoamylase family protein [Jiangellaceae bacterium]
MRSTRLALAGITGVAVVAALVPAAASAATSTAPPRDDRGVLLEYAQDTWASFEAMVEPATALPADNIDGDLDPATRSRYTSPTNIGGYLWSTIVARDLRLIDRDDAYDRMAATLATVAGLDRHDDSGMFYNWYDPQTLEVLRIWPEDGNTVYPFLSSVDNGWLAVALKMVGAAEPRLRQEANALYTTMDFGFYYDAAAKADVGLIRGGFWDEPPPGCSILGNYRDRGPDVYYTCHHYGAFNSEPRIASYLGIANGQIPPEHYFGPWRTFPADNCDWSWSDHGGIGEWREYLGVQVWEGAYDYRDMYVVPTWGGSMFEALMPDLFVPEAQWGPDSWGVNHPLFVRGQIEHGMADASYGYWGFSPSSNPAGGYREYGVDMMGMDEPGYTSDQERTSVDPGFFTVDGTQCRAPQPPPEEYGDGVVTPHAVFLALPYAPAEALDNLARLRADLDVYGAGGFFDAVGVRSGQVAERYLALDQGMIMAAIGNYLRHDMVKGYFVDGQFKHALRPLMAMEEFAARPSAG